MSHTWLPKYLQQNDCDGMRREEETSPPSNLHNSGAIDAVTIKAASVNKYSRLASNAARIGRDTPHGLSAAELQPGSEEERPYHMHDARLKPIRQAETIQ